MDDNDLPLFKIVIVGDTEVGKTCVLNRFLDQEPNREHRSTIGVEFGSKIVRNAHIKAKFQIWDTAGQQRYRAITSAYYRGAMLIVFVYDLTNRETFTKLEVWIKEAKDNASPECQFVLIGNKIDLDARQVTPAEASTFATQHNMSYIEVSAIENLFMDEAMDVISEVLGNRAEGNTIRIAGDKSEAEDKWRDKMLPLLGHVHDTKFHQNYQIYSPLIKLTAPKLLETHVQDELFRVSDDKQLWHKILNNLQFGTREELSLVEISQVLQISMIMDCSALKKYAMAQLSRRINRDKIFGVLPDMVKLPFMNEDHKRAVLQYLYQVPVSTIRLNKVQSLVDQKTFDDFLIWKDKPKELSPLLEIDTEQEQKRTPQERFFTMTRQLLAHRDLTGDLVLKSGGSDESNPVFSVKVHKLVVAARCDFINSCLSSNLKEASEGVIEIKGFNEEELEALIQYFYTNSYEHIVNPNVCITIISMAPYLMLTKEANSSNDHSVMLTALEKTVLDDITDDTCLDLVLNAHKNQDDELKKIAVKYITNNYFNVLAKHEDQFVKLPKALMFTLMNKMLLKLSIGNNNNN